MSDSAQERLFQAQEQREKAQEAGDIAAQILAAEACGQAHFDLGQNKFALAMQSFWAF